MDQAHGGSITLVKDRRPLTWQLLAGGRRAVPQAEKVGVVTWAGLALSFSLAGSAVCSAFAPSCVRTVSLRQYSTEQVHPEFWFNTQEYFNTARVL